jgi:hypothetical protein
MWTSCGQLGAQQKAPGCSGLPGAVSTRKDDLIVERNLLDLFWIYRRLAKDSFW